MSSVCSNGVGSKYILVSNIFSGIPGLSIPLLSAISISLSLFSFFLKNISRIITNNTRIIIIEYTRILPVLSLSVPPLLLGLYRIINNLLMI